VREVTRGVARILVLILGAVAAVSGLIGYLLGKGL
jgi:hypothetical protein